MPMTQQIISQNHTQPINEYILVVKKECLFPDGPWQGLKEVDFDSFIEIIQKNKEFLPREHMETNPAFKQIIPYLIFTYKNRYFLMQRQSKASETRLQNKYTLGIGGHIRQEDLSYSALQATKDRQEGNLIFDWAKREFHEEINYYGSLKITPIGIINDDSNEVGKVHIGFVLLLEGDSNQISIKSELKSGFLIPLDECQMLTHSMETWSQIVVAHLKNQ